MNLEIQYTKRFIKSLPKDKEKLKRIFNDVKTIKELHCNMDYPRLASEFNFEILDQETAKERNRYRFSLSDRIHAYISKENNAIIFLEYSADHDKGLGTEYLPKNQQLAKLPKNLEQLIPLTLNDGFIYELDEKQKQYKDATYFSQPLIVIGTAGSGKTSVALDKIMDYFETEKDCKIAYFTYNSSLCKFIIDELDLYGINRDNITAQALKDFIPVENIGIFDKWFSAIKNHNINVDKNVLKHEIRNILKGSFNEDLDEENYHQRLKKRKQLLSLDEYLKMSNKYHIEEEAKKTIYKYAQQYQKYVSENNLFDENDIFEIKQDYNNKFDFLIIDEVQDFTEVQIAHFLSYVKDKNNIMLCGDVHQSINNYQFSFNRIKKIIELETAKKYQSKENQLLLNKNYRNSKKIVDYINILREIRRKHIGTIDQELETDDISALEDYKRESMLTIIDKNNLSDFTKNINDTDTVYITFTKEDKTELEKIVDNKEAILDIFEIKGLEFTNVVIYNPLENCKLKEALTAKENKNIRSVIRVGFNKYFTAITRAKNSILVCDTLDSSTEVYNKYFNQFFINLEANADFSEIGFTTIETPEEWNEIALQREKKCEPDDYKTMEYIKGLFIKGQNEQKVKEIEILIKYKDAKDNTKCIEELIANGSFQKARELFINLGDNINAIAMLFFEKDYDKANKLMRQNNISIDEILVSKYGAKLVLRKTIENEGYINVINEQLNQKLGEEN